MADLLQFSIVHATILYKVIVVLGNAQQLGEKNIGEKEYESQKVPTSSPGKISRFLDSF